MRRYTNAVEVTTDGRHTSTLRTGQRVQVRPEDSTPVGCSLWADYCRAQKCLTSGASPDHGTEVRS